MAVLAPLGAVAAFVAFWLLLSHGLNVAAGWRGLSARWGVDGAPGGKSFRWRSGQLGAVHYRSALNFVVSPDGLFLAPVLIFRTLYRGALVPWEAVRFEGQVRLLTWRRFRYRLGDGPRLTVDPDVAEAMAPYLPAAERERWRAGAAGEPLPWKDKRAVLWLALGGAGSGLLAGTMARLPQWRSYPRAVILLPLCAAAVAVLAERDE